MPTQTKRAARPAPRPAGKVDKRRARGEARSQNIIDAAIDLIAAEGLANVTMQRIAEKVQATSALVVFHFRNKENLFQAVLEHLSAVYDDLWQQHVMAPGLSSAARLWGALVCAQTFRQRYPKAVSVFIAFCGDRKSMRLYRKVALPDDRSYQALARQLFDEIAQEGNYRDLDLDLICDSLNYLIYGVWLGDHVAPNKAKSDMLLRCALAILQQAFPRHFPLKATASSARPSDPNASRSGG